MTDSAHTHPKRTPLFAINSMRLKITFGIILILSPILFIFNQFNLLEERNIVMAHMDEHGTETIDFIALLSAESIVRGSLSQLDNFVAQVEKGRLVAYCTIYDTQKNILAQAPLVTPRQEQDNIQVFTTNIVDNQTLLGAVELGMRLDPALARIDKTEQHITIAFLLELLFIGCAVNYFIHKSLVSPVVRLSTVTSEIATGNFVTSDLAVRRDEVGELAEKINLMSGSLKDSYHSLEQQVAARTEALSRAKNNAEQMAQHLRVVNSEIQALLDNSPIGIIFIDSNRLIQRVNLEFLRFSGYRAEELIGQTTEQFYLSPSDFHKTSTMLYTVLNRDGSCQTTLNMRRKDGTPVMVSVHGRLTVIDDGEEGVIWCVEDITSRLKMEEELLKIKKLESVSVLAGGIAHDFNNILVAIIGNISLAERLIADSPKVVELLHNSKLASLRAKELTIKLLTFATGGDTNKSIELLPEILKDSASFVLSGSNVKCTYDIADDLWAIIMDKTKINQVIQNIILNSDQSMPDGGTVAITCRNKVVHDNEIIGLKGGNYVRMDISDTGSGILDEHIDSIFDPYFSTKEKDSNKGSGLGLSIVHSIISQHGGTIFVESVKGEGTTFTIYMPATEEEVETRSEPESILPTGKGLVLIMDDEEAIHAISRDMLAYLGYESLSAYSGQEAIDIYRNHSQTGDPIDIIIMDLTIPGGMGGAAAVQQILKLDSRAKVIVSSGYSDNPILQNYKDSGFVHMITKPYQLLDLSRVLAESMES